MNALVIYDSLYGNTQRLAELMTLTLNELGQARALRVEQANANDLHGINLLVLGSPTHGLRPSSATLSFLATLSPQVLHGLYIACFDTRYAMPSWLLWLTGTAAGRAAKLLEKEGARSIVAPESFIVQGREGPLAEGELDHAEHWAHKLHELVEDRSPVRHPM